MSYWDECEPSRGEYQFDALDSLIKCCADNNAEVTLCLGLRQPRWPECHPPAWLDQLTLSEKHEALYAFITVVVQRYRNSPALVSYQLENEAFNKGIGTCVDYDRARLIEEFNLVKELDPSRPAIMSTSNSWGLPAFGPIPDAIGVSLYTHQWTHNGLSRRHRSPAFHRSRVLAMKILWRRPVICHELQMEPWGDKGTEQLSNKTQLELMSAEQMELQLQYAQKCGFDTVDLWGLEWWYWRRVTLKDDKHWSAIRMLVEKERVIT